MSTEVNMGTDQREWYTAIVPTLPAGPVVEVGVWLGGSVIHLAKLVPEREVFAVDVFDGGPCATPEMKQVVVDHGGSLLEAFQQNVEAAKVRITFYPGTSLEAAKVFAGTGFKFALVFLDSSHAYAETKAEIEAWRKLIVPGGVLAGHDYSPDCGVKKAVDEVLGNVSVYKSCWSIRL